MLARVAPIVPDSFSVSPLAIPAMNPTKVLPAIAQILVVFMLVAIAWADTPAQLPTPSRTQAAVPNAAASGQRRREGTRIVEQAGKFEFVGDRIAFFPTGESDSFRVLENLAAERIVRLLGESRGQQDWLVSGTLTEFRGSNYLLVTKAVIRPGSDRPIGP
jgi:hypothetical protein